MGGRRPARQAPTGPKHRRLRIPRRPPGAPPRDLSRARGAPRRPPPLTRSAGRQAVDSIAVRSRRMGSFGEAGLGQVAHAARSGAKASWSLHRRCRRYAQLLSEHGELWTGRDRGAVVCKRHDPDLRSTLEMLRRETKKYLAQVPLVDSGRPVLLEKRRSTRPSSGAAALRSSRARDADGAGDLVTRAKTAIAAGAQESEGDAAEQPQHEPDPASQENRELR